MTERVKNVSIHETKRLHESEIAPAFLIIFIQRFGSNKIAMVVTNPHISSKYAIYFPEKLIKFE